MHKRAVEVRKSIDDPEISISLDLHNAILEQRLVNFAQITALVYLLIIFPLPFRRVMEEFTLLSDKDADSEEGEDEPVR